MNGKPMNKFLISTASEMARSWGMVASVYTDEVTESGRPISRLLTPDEVAERAVLTAAALMAEFIARGWAENELDDEK